MIKKIIQGGSTPSEFDLHVDGADRGDATYTLMYAGTKWNKPWQGAKAIKVHSDGNKVTATIYKDAKGRKAETIDLEFGEAVDLAITLLEFTKGDPHAHSPLYEVLDKEEYNALQKKTSRRKR